MTMCLDYPFTDYCQHVGENIFYRCRFPAVTHRALRSESVFEFEFVYEYERRSAAVSGGQRRSAAVTGGHRRSPAVLN